MMTNVDKELEFLKKEISAYGAEHGELPQRLLEITVAQISFMQLFAAASIELEPAIASLIRKHLMQTLEMATNMVDMPAKEVNHVIKKSIELVDSINAIHDPSRTNLH
jgi:hypothetical protein